MHGQTALPFAQRLTTATPISCRTDLSDVAFLGPPEGGERPRSVGRRLDDQFEDALAVEHLGRDVVGRRARVVAAVGRRALHDVQVARRQQPQTFCRTATWVLFH